MDINDIIGNLGGQGGEFNPSELIGKMLSLMAMKQALAEAEDESIKRHLEEKLGIRILKGSAHCSEWRLTHANCIGCESCLGCCKHSLISQRLSMDSQRDAELAVLAKEAGKIPEDRSKAGNRCARICVHIENAKSVIEAKYWFGIMPRWKVWQERILNLFGKSLSKPEPIASAHLPDDTTLADLLK